MHLVAMVFAIFAALLHVFIFYMESISWTSEKTRSTFGMSEEAAENTKEKMCIRDRHQGGARFLEVGVKPEKYGYR